jgi:hypothetical protein
MFFGGFKLQPEKITTEKKNVQSSGRQLETEKNKTVQIEIGLLEYGRNKKAVRTDCLLAKHKN